MMREAPLGHDRAAARHDAGDALGGERDVAQQHARVDGEVVHALLGLLDQRVAVDVPGQLFRLASDLLERLVDRHGPDRYRRVPEDPLAGLVDVLARREVHHGVGAPAGRPRHLLDFLLDGGGDGRVADVGVDLHEEPTADHHRLGLGVVNVRREDRAPARDLVADEFGRYALAQGDELHLGCDLAPARVVHLGDPPARPGAERQADAREPHAAKRGVFVATAPVRRRRPGQLLHVAAAEDPRQTQRGQAALQVDARVGIGVRAARVVETEGRVAARERDLAHRYTEVRPRADEVDLAGHLGPPFAGINQVRFMRSAAVAALSARFPELPRLWAVVLKVGYARFRTLATSVAASLSQCYSRSFSGNG